MTRRLRAENVGVGAMQQLAAAHGRVVNYQGFHAVLRLDMSVSLETKRPRSIVELEFDRANGHPRADGDFSILAELPFLNPDAHSKGQ
jgi:hypothetical protein